MQPITIQTRAAGPYNAPRIGPKIGPTPAIFNSCIKATFHVGIGTKSTPSSMATAGVVRFWSDPKIRSTIVP